MPILVPAGGSERYMRDIEGSSTQKRTERKSRGPAAARIARPGRGGPLRARAAAVAARPERRWSTARRRLAVHARVALRQEQGARGGGGARARGRLPRHHRAAAGGLWRRRHAHAPALPRRIASRV